jgi:nucleoid-associated protein YgaU
MESSDPFDNGPSIQQEEADESESKEIRQVKSESRTYELSTADEEVVELPALETEEQPSQFDSDNERRRGASRRRAAPENFSFEAESSRSEAAHGETYTVEPNDNFWNISRKRYGAGRYYMALAMHNRRTVPDPKRMKPGVVISTPDAAVLEQRYPEAMPKAAADSSDSVISTQVRQSADAERSGYFVSDDGEPMYRVGAKDTLTDIAKTHLNRTSRWVQILNMNRNILRDGNELKVGTVLRLPADASRVRVAESSTSFR